MSRPAALTSVQRRRLHRLGVARRELVRQLKALPTRSELAREMCVSERTVARGMGAAPARKRVRTTMLKDLVW